MTAFSVVGVEPWGKCVGPVGVGGEGLPVGPLDLQGAVEPFDASMFVKSLGSGRVGLCGGGWAGEVGEDLAGDVTLEAADDLAFGESFSGAAFDVGAGEWVVAHADDRDDVEGAVGCSVAASAETVTACVRPLEAGCGATPQSFANAASVRIRSGLSPAVTRNWPASSTPTPCSWTSSGAAVRTKMSSWLLSCLISSSRVFQRRARSRSDVFTPARRSLSGVSRRESRSSVSGRGRRQRLTRVRLVRWTSPSRSGDGAPIITPKRVLNAWVRALTALARVTRRVRMTSTVPDLAFGMAVEVSPRTARAICSASSRSDLPSILRASRLGRFTSTTCSPAADSARVRVAPNEPVLSTPIAWSGPWPRIHASNAPYPWSVAGNCWWPSSRPVSSTTAA